MMYPMNDITFLESFCFGQNEEYSEILFFVGGSSRPMHGQLCKWIVIRETNQQPLGTMTLPAGNVVILF